MQNLNDLRPVHKQLVIDAVRSAGIDVSDWGDYEGGEDRASTNPKYCYEWSFVEPKKVVVLNLWHQQMEILSGAIFQKFNMREISLELGRLPGKGVWSKRATNMDVAIQNAFKDGLPVRVVVCDGPRRGTDRPITEASRVEKRQLDQIPWAVTEYNWETGDCVIVRGASPELFVDQFSLNEDESVKKQKIEGEAYVRDPEVRRQVRLRAQGRCELCGTRGFTMSNGRLYIEVHHVIPLSEQGPDKVENVVALCPSHHREAHHGVEALTIQNKLIEYLAKS
jgi:5-methylcytosine-specific restriction enzyme A